MRIHKDSRNLLVIVGAIGFLVLLFAVLTSGVLAFWLDPEPEQDSRAEIVVGAGMEY